MFTTDFSKISSGSFRSLSFGVLRSCPSHSSEADAEGSMVEAPHQSGLLPKEQLLFVSETAKVAGRGNSRRMQAAVKDGVALLSGGV